MIDTLKIFEQLSQAMEPAAARKLVEVLGVIYEDLQNTVTKAEFLELKEVVRDLAEAQKRTEERLEALAGRVEELAQAQKRTEEALRVLIERVEAHEIRLAKLDGRTLEMQFRDKAAAEERLEGPGGGGG